MIDDDQICYEDDLCDLLNQLRVETSFVKIAVYSVLHSDTTCANIVIECAFCNTADSVFNLLPFLNSRAVIC
jgi:hypothetical protein